MLDKAVEYLVIAARARLAGAGYPADDLSDEEVWAGRRVWWGREAEWTAVARECPEIAGAIVMWAASRLPKDVRVNVRMVGNRYQSVEVMMRAGRDGFNFQRGCLLLDFDAHRSGLSIDRWVDFQMGEVLNLLRVQQHEAMHVTPPSGDPDNHMRYQPPLSPLRPHGASDVIPPGSL